VPPGATPILASIHIKRKAYNLESDMRTFAQNQPPSPKQTPPTIAKAHAAIPGCDQQRQLIHYLQRNVGNQAVLRMLQRQPPAGANTAAPSNPVPGLGPTRTQTIDSDIQAGDSQGALDWLVSFKYMDYEIDLTLLKDRKMTFDPSVTWADATSGMPSWDYINNKADPTAVRVGPSAFSSVAYLYSVVMHEYQHVLWRQSLANQQHEQQVRARGSQSSSEVEAYAWELLHAKETGLARLPDKAATIWEKLNDAFWAMEAADRGTVRSLALRARTQAAKIVKGTGETLVPFQPP
jgi:hypothetical protein